MTTHAHHAAAQGSTTSGLNAMAASATLHCLTGCAIGEILGLMIGTAIGLSAFATIGLAVGLAFLFGYLLSTLPLLNAGLGFFSALSVVFAADTLSIATMEVVDNAVMALIPGAMEAGLTNPIFWLSMMLALSVAFAAAFPVNRFLLRKGKGHALTHQYHGGHGDHSGDHDHGSHDHGEEKAKPRRLPVPDTVTLAVALVTFMLGGLTVSIADELESDADRSPHGASARVADPR